MFSIKKVVKNEPGTSLITVQNKRNVKVKSPYVKVSLPKSKARVSAKRKSPNKGKRIQAKRKKIAQNSSVDDDECQIINEVTCISDEEQISGDDEIYIGETQILKQEDDDCIDLVSSDDEKPKSKKNDNQLDYPIWNVADVLAEVSGIPQNVANNVVNLIEEENTLPFIARYRKTMVDYMSPENLQTVFNSYHQVCKMRRKSIAILKTLQKSEKLTSSITNSILSARSNAELDLLYDPLKSRNSVVEKVRTLGLDKHITSILEGNDVSIRDLCNEKMKTPSEVETNLIIGLANAIYVNPETVDFIRTLKNKTIFNIECSKARIRTSKKENIKKETTKRKADDPEKFNRYMDFNMRSDFMKPHQILAVNRGESLKILQVKVVIPYDVFENFIKFCNNKWRREIVDKAALVSFKKYIKPWLTRHVRSDMLEKARKESISVFCSNLQRLLLTTPVKGHNILGIDPGFKAGCKIAIIGTSGQPLETFIIHPRFESRTDPEMEKLSLFAKKYKCTVIALGNGTACRETEKWLHSSGILNDAHLIIVPECGASIYSCSPDASKEFPGMDPNIISAISLARRAQDPLSELIKVNPKHIGIGMYQHDIPGKLLDEALDNIIVNCVTFVGVDINTCSSTLLEKIAGLTKLKAANILQYREEVGEFKCREELRKVATIGDQTYKQCIGFLRVPKSKNKLDNTWIHPESYNLAIRFIKIIGLDVTNVGTDEFICEFKRKIEDRDLNTFAVDLSCNKGDIELIVDALCQKPLEDPLRNVKPIYSAKLSNVDQLTVNAILNGVVRNVTPFGVFVDCGVGRNGLIHTSKFGKSRTPVLGDKVIVKVIEPPTSTKISLELINIVE